MSYEFNNATKQQCAYIIFAIVWPMGAFVCECLVGLRVLTSSNVFLENLHSTRHLETVYFLTDTTQASDFFWVRESGLKVNIGIYDLHLIPEYEDVDHVSDNDYVLGNPQSVDEKAHFRRVLDNYCRCAIDLSIHQGSSAQIT